MRRRNGMMRRVARRVRSIVPGLLEVGGAAAVTFGAWQIWNPLAWIVGGALGMSAAYALTVEDES